MAYTVTYHGIQIKSFRHLAELVQGYGFNAPDASTGVMESADAEVAFRYEESEKKLTLSVRRLPTLMTRGVLYGMVADALIDSGAEYTDALSEE